MRVAAARPSPLLRQRRNATIQHLVSQHLQDHKSLALHDHGRQHSTRTNKIQQHALKKNVCASNLLQACFKLASNLLQTCFKKSTRVAVDSFKCASTMLQFFEMPGQKSRHGNPLECQTTTDHERGSSWSVVAPFSRTWSV